MLLGRLVAEFDHYLTKQSSLHDFETFVLEHLQEAIDSEDERTSVLFDETDAALIRFREGDIGEEEFLDAVEAAIAETSTLRQHFDGEALHASVAEGDTVHRCILVTEREDFSAPVLAFG